MYKILGFASLLFFAHCSLAQFGELDPTFGTNGIVETEFAQYYDEEIKEMLIQPDGKIVLCGTDYVDTYDVMLLRYNADGSADSNFGIDGKATFHYGESFTANYGVAVVLQQDGKFIIAAYSETQPGISFNCLRVHADGSLDSSFGENGVVTVFIDDYDAIANDVLLQPDGKIIVTGHANVNAAGEDMAAIRMHPDGTLDDTFGANGVVSNLNNVCGVSYTNCALQSDGKILISGYGSTQGDHVFCLMRLNEDGNLDNTFNEDGIQMTTISGYYNHPQAILLQPDGKILLAGYAGAAASSVNPAMVRYTSTGNLDPTFAVNGIFLDTSTPGSDWISDVCLQPDGKILTCGLTTQSDGGWDFVVMRVNTNGSLDGSFGENGYVNTAFTLSDARGEAIALQNDGKIVASGYASFGVRDAVIARYTSGLPVGIESVQMLDSSMYPNPFNDLLIIKNKHEQLPMNISICNSVGILIHSQRLTTEQTTLSTDHLASGVYYIQSSDSKGNTVTQKMVKH